MTLLILGFKHDYFIHSLSKRLLFLIILRSKTFFIFYAFCKPFPFAVRRKIDFAEYNSTAKLRNLQELCYTAFTENQHKHPHSPTLNRVEVLRAKGFKASENQILMSPKEYARFSPSVVIKLACKDNYFIYCPQTQHKKMAADGLDTLRDDELPRRGYKGGRY